MSQSFLCIDNGVKLIADLLLCRAQKVTVLKHLTDIETPPAMHIKTEQAEGFAATG